MAVDKKSFLLYTDLHFTVKKLSDEQAGKLFKHILGYVNDENPTPFDLIIELVFEPIKQSLKRDLRKYETIKVKRSQAGKASADKRQQVSTCVNTSQQVSTNPTVNDSDSDSDSDINNKKNNYKTLLVNVVSNNKIILPEKFEELILEWLKYKSEKGQSYKEIGLKTFIKTFLKDSNSDYNIAQGMLDYSMSKNYSGLFKEKTNGSNKQGDSRSDKRTNDFWNT